MLFEPQVYHPLIFGCSPSSLSSSVQSAKNGWGRKGCKTREHRKPPRLSWKLSIIPLECHINWKEKKPCKTSAVRFVITVSFQSGGGREEMRETAFLDISSLPRDTSPLHMLLEMCWVIQYQFEMCGVCFVRCNIFAVTTQKGAKLWLPLLAMFIYPREKQTASLWGSCLKLILNLPLAHNGFCIHIDNRIIGVGQRLFFCSKSLNVHRGGVYTSLCKQRMYIGGDWIMTSPMCSTAGKPSPYE